MQPIVETRVPVMLGGEKRVLIFNMNCMCAYEEATGKFFLDTVATLYDAMAPAIAVVEANKTGDATSSPTVSVLKAFDVVRKVPMKDLRALIWASIHEYDANDEPHWPLTLFQVGRMLKMEDVLPIFTAFLRGQAANQPSKEEMGESRPVVPGDGAPPVPITPIADGGEASIALPGSAFA